MNNEKAYKTMKSAGAGSIALGIIALVTGLTTGIILLIQGGRLLKNKSTLLF